MRKLTNDRPSRRSGVLGHHHKRSNAGPYLTCAPEPLAIKLANSSIGDSSFVRRITIHHTIRSHRCKAVISVNNLRTFNCIRVFQHGPCTFSLIVSWLTIAVETPASISTEPFPPERTTESYETTACTRITGSEFFILLFTDFCGRNTTVPHSLPHQCNILTQFYPYSYGEVWGNNLETIGTSEKWFNIRVSFSTQLLNDFQNFWCQPLFTAYITHVSAPPS